MHEADVCGDWEVVASTALLICLSKQLSQPREGTAPGASRGQGEGVDAGRGGMEDGYRVLWNASRAFAAQNTTPGIAVAVCLAREAC